VETLTALPSRLRRLFLPSAVHSELLISFPDRSMNRLGRRRLDE